MKKLQVGILFGGKSAEHKVSLQSAKNVIEALDKEKFEPVLISIDTSGKWHLADSSTFLLHAENPSLITLSPVNQGVALLPGETQGELVSTTTIHPVGSLDVIFPVMHGPMGEDGTIQGLLRLAELPFVGAGVLGSAIGMDKDVMKRLLRDAGLPVANFLVYSDAERENISYDDISKKLGLPFFVKPANMGSSIGVSKAKDEDSFNEAIRTAFEFDTKVLLEEAIQGVEIECAVLGNSKPIASVPGKIVPRGEFYSYEAKYIDEHGAILEIPADLPSETVAAIQCIAVKAFEVLVCEGMARIDMFVTPEGKAVLNEINTIPGFTNVSMYPKLWEASGIPYTDLITRLIELAIDRHQRQKRLRTSYA
jgi:D-alanine-D-alanine ligase